MTVEFARFIKSRAGTGFIKYALACALFSAGIAYATYMVGLNGYTADKRDEKITALQLVDAFVTNYSSIRAQFGEDKVPVPASFRAHSLELFNKMRDSADLLRLVWVGRADRFIATPPADADMAGTIEAFTHERDPQPVSQFLNLNGNTVFRTVYPSTATQQSCVDCHNRMQPNLHWQLNEVMGAFAIDVPAGAFLRGHLLRSVGLGFVIFGVFCGAGLFVAIVSFRRIVERKTSEARLRESEQRFRDFAEATSDWFWEQDHNLRFTALSDGVIRSGLGNTSHIGKTRREVVSLGVTDEQWAAHEADLAARRPFQNFRFQRRVPSGELRHISVSGKPIFDRKGKFQGYRGTARDVTAEVAHEVELSRHVEARTAELRMAQAELIRKERLSALGQLTATVAHELRNPLSVIRNSIFAVKGMLAAQKLPLDRPFARIDRGIERCDRIVTDLLDFTRIRELQRTSLDADRWLHEVLDEQVLPEGVRLLRDTSAPGVQLSFDPERLRRVIVNLVDNAVQAMPEASADARERQITVSTRIAADGYFEVEVKDNGPGMTAEVLAKVFEPLFSTKSFGTGLGLPMVKQVVEQHSGKIDITSMPGEGTRVVVRLPLSATEEIAA
jgi:PAS domain S-box-containing protein